MGGLKTKTTDVTNGNNSEGKEPMPPGLKEETITK
jgi:hypothetical protein